MLFLPEWKYQNFACTILSRQQLACIYSALLARIYLLGCTLLHFHLQLCFPSIWEREVFQPGA